MSTVTTPANPKVGFVSLGCPKALVDSERILTQLRMEGYDVVSTYQDADVVVVNTCGFIDSAKAESLEVIGEAIKENGKVIVTGCMGVEEGNIRNVHPSVLAARTCARGNGQGDHTQYKRQRGHDDRTQTHAARFDRQDRVIGQQIRLESQVRYAVFRVAGHGTHHVHQVGYHGRSRWLHASAGAVEQGRASPGPWVACSGISQAGTVLARLSSACC